MVMNLDRIEKCEERSELVGHVAVLFNNFNLAQNSFLNSSRPKEALYLRMDLLEWEQALTLAKKYAPEEISYISLEYASQLELEGRFGEAHTQYEQALSLSGSFNGKQNEISDHEWSCKVGLTRMTFALGDLARGMALLADIKDIKVLEDCIAILESLKQFNEAGVLLERANLWDRAAECWIRCNLFLIQVKNWPKVSLLYNKISNPKIFALIGKAKEEERNYSEAANAYEKAKDYDSVINILIVHMNDLEHGASLVRKTGATESAKLVAQLYLKDRKFSLAVEFYIMAGLKIEAFQLAKEQNIVEYFSTLIQEDASISLCIVKINF
jgi:WD repeat-containing protein 19